jgi:hypothetical protein
LETDLLFDARYADLMKALVLDEQQRDASETLPRDPAVKAWTSDSLFLTQCRLTAKPKPGRERSRKNS